MRSVNVYFRSNRDIFCALAATIFLSVMGYLTFWRPILLISYPYTPRLILLGSIFFLTFCLDFQYPLFPRDQVLDEQDRAESRRSYRGSNNRLRRSVNFRFRLAAVTFYSRAATVFLLVMGYTTFSVFVCSILLIFSIVALFCLTLCLSSYVTRSISRLKQSSLVNPFLIIRKVRLDSNDRPQLPVNVVPEIVNRLPTIEDVIAAARPHQLPFLVLSQILGTPKRKFLSLLNVKFYEFPMPEILRKRCWGSPHGWVVALGPDLEPQVVHLVKGVQIALPPLHPIEGLPTVPEWFYSVHKFILFKEPSHGHEPSFLVFAIFGTKNCLAFTRVGGAALNRRGQGKWAIVSYDSEFRDVACFKDQLYGVCDNGVLVRFDLDDPLSDGAGVEFIASQPQDVQEYRKPYLVGSSENLYMVFRCRVPSHSENHVTKSFLVYKFNFNAIAWEEVTNLENLAVFVGDGNSWCAPTNIPSSRNRIHFTDDHWDWKMYQGETTFGGRDVGVYDMASKAIEYFTSTDFNPHPYFRPIWATLTMNLD